MSYTKNELRALVVDVDSQIARLIEATLSQLGISDITIINDGAQALARVETVQQPFSFAVCDWMMPNMDGLEYLERFRNIHPDTPFVMLTGNADDELGLQAIRLGVQDYLGLARSVEILLEVGIEAIREHIFRVQEPILHWAAAKPDLRLWTPLEASRRAGIVSFFPRDAREVAEVLRREKVVFSLREGAIRFAPHFYNTVAEMERVVEILDAAV